MLALILGPAVLHAHDPGLSSATVDLATRDILVQLVFAPADLAVFADEPRADLAARSVTCRTRDMPLKPKSVDVHQVGLDNVEFTLRFPRPTGEVHLRSMLLPALRFGHRQTFTLRDTKGAIVSTDLFSTAHDSVMIPAAPPGEGFPLETIGKGRTHWGLLALGSGLGGAAWLWRRRILRRTDA